MRTAALFFVLPWQCCSRRRRRRVHAYFRGYESAWHMLQTWRPYNFPGSLELQLYERRNSSGLIERERYIESQRCTLSCFVQACDVFSAFNVFSVFDVSNVFNVYFYVYVHVQVHVYGCVGLCL